MTSLKDYEGLPTAWCPGCGNFSILAAVKKALFELTIPPYKVAIVSGIGQSGKLPHYLKCNTFNGLHGRTLPVATGIKTANHELTVLAVGGDGDGYGEGGNHFIHAIRRNPDITYLVHDNQIYGLTKGQASPTSDLGLITKTTPRGVSNTPLNPLALAIVLGCTFVARGFAGELEHLTEIIKQGITHKGFSLIDILQPCVSFNHVNTYQWYSERVYKINYKDYNSSDKYIALKKSFEWEQKIPIGIIYKTKRDLFNDKFPALKDKPLVKQKIDPHLFAHLIDGFI